MTYLPKVIDLKKNEAPVFKISILDIYKKAELTDDNINIIKWVSKYLFNDSGYCYEQRIMTYDHIVKNYDIFLNIFKTSHWQGNLKKWGQEIVLDEN